MCMIEACDPVQFGKNEMRRARKPHKCEECGRVISPGETYRYTFLISDGFPESFATCGHCSQAQEWLLRECGGYVTGALWEDVQEHVQEYPRLLFPLGRLIVGKRRQWRDMPIPNIPTATIGIREGEAA